MANFLSTKPREDERDIQPNELLLEILRQEFPDNPIYQQGRLLQDDQPDPVVEQIIIPEFQRPSRSSRNVLNCNVSAEEHVNYKMRRFIPSVDNDTLDDLLDDEWETFIDDEIPSIDIDEDVTDNIFLINPVNPLIPLDYHDAYLTKGPQQIPETGNVDEIFCVFYIRNNIAYPIPNYKTLEVMLVERKLTYNDIKEASNEQLATFDMSFDGITEIANEEVNAFAEFNARAVTDRSSEWNRDVRYKSGYKQGEPFKRDPGDYYDVSSNSYFEKVYQTQTLLEGFRTRFEGRMVILTWPVDAAGNLDTGEFDALIQNEDTNPLNDLITSVRIMTNGYWKQVTDAEVFRAYAYTNNISLRGFIDEPPVSVNGVYETDDRYQVAGYINQLVQAGGIIPLQAENVDSNTRNGDDIVWNSFPHIIEADRMDVIEYQNYINNYSNASAPFDIENLNLYEPEGSIKYYDEVRLAELEDQLLQQSQIDSIIPIIYDKFEEASAVLSNTLQTLNSTQRSLANIVEETIGLGDESDLLSIVLSQDKWKYVKRIRNGLKTKESENSLFKLIEKSGRVTAELSREEEDDVAGNWCRVPEIQSSLADDIESVESVAQNAATYGAAAATSAVIGSVGVPLLTALPGLGAAFAVFKVAKGYATSIANDNEYALPRRFDNTRNNLLMRDDKFVIQCLANAMNDKNNPNRTLLSEYSTNMSIYQRAVEIDERKEELRTLYNQVAGDFDQILTRIQEADNIDTFRSILDDINVIININAELSALAVEITTFTNAVEITTTKFVKDIYKSIQQLRQRVQNVGNTKKFGIEWPASAAAIVKRYVPGATFDNYLPE